MKKGIFIGILLIAAILVGTVYFVYYQPIKSLKLETNSSDQLSPMEVDQTSNIAGVLSHNIVINSSVKTLKKSIPVYKTLPPDVNTNTTLALAEKFNVTGNMIGDQGVQSKDLRYTIWTNKQSGTIEYRDSNRPNEEMDAPENLPSDDESVTIANKFLKERELLLEGAIATQPRYEYTYSSETTKKYGRVCIWFNRTLDGLDVKGTKLVVYLGGNGDVIGYYSNWRDYKLYKEYPVISQDNAFEQLKVKGVAVDMDKQESKVSIDEADLAYRTKPGSKAEDYLEPVWMFTGKVMVDGKSVKAVEEYIPALSEESVKSLSS